MGIKHFFYWFKTNFKKYMDILKSGEDISDKKVTIDHLMIDLNGIFHPAAQKIYKYGNHKPLPRLLRKPKQLKYNKYKLKISMFEEVCKYIEKLLDIVKPQKTLILCVDGPAPLSKQNQQRQRRFRAITEKNDKELSKFDSNCLSPGTKFMDQLTSYINWYIHKKISSDLLWKNLQIIFSNEKCPGEGEHKLINFIRNFGHKDDRYCIHGLDADLIMLSLTTQCPNFWILRENIYDNVIKFFLINIGKTRKELGEKMNWKIKSGLREKQVRKYLDENGFAQFPNKKSGTRQMEFKFVNSINDFVFMCFMVGNDFLPHTPSLEIIEGGIDEMLDIYNNTGKSYGHLTEVKNKKVVINKVALQIFLGTIANKNKNILENKLLKKSEFFPDPLLEKYATFENGKYELDMEGYKKEYYEKHFPGENIQSICHEYIIGMQWVISYYTQGVPDWTWCYKYHYAPFAEELAKYMDTLKIPLFLKNIPSEPFQQLISILPPKSSNLIPHPLSQLLTDSKSPLKKFCPSSFEIDISGKRQQWEGIVILPIIDHCLVKKEYKRYISKVNKLDIRRNKRMKSFLYEYTPHETFTFRSKYGCIFDCKATTSYLDL